MRSDEIHPGDLIAGRYRVRTLLGRTHGLLLEAFHTEFDQRVVVKILPAGHGDAKEIERFRREARTLAKLESEHVARIIDVGSQDDGSFFLVRQYLEGVDLGRYLQKSGPLPLSDAVLLLAQAAEAVAETHSHGIILRELEPSHLFLTQRAGGAPLLKVIDFGTAKLMREVAAPTAGGELTATAMFGLSPYSSPELVRKAKNVDVRTDVWSLGAIFYEMLTGRPPFTGELGALMLQITKEEALPASQFRPDLPAEVNQVFGWALAKDLDGRFRDVHALMHALLPYASPEGRVLIERIGQISQAAKGRQPAPAPAPPPDPGTEQRSGLEDSVTRIKGGSFVTPLDALAGAPAPIPAAGKAIAPVPPPVASSPAAASAPGAGAGEPAVAAPPPAPSGAGAIAPQGDGGLPVPAAAVSQTPPVRPLAVPPPQGDRRVLYGALAALAVLVPVLVAIFVISRKAGGDAPSATEGGPIKIELPAQTAAHSVASPAPAPSAAESSAPVAAAPSASASAEAQAEGGDSSESPAEGKEAEDGPPASATGAARKPPVTAVKAVTPIRKPATDSASADTASKSNSTSADPPSSASATGPGTLVAVATGGNCAFSVNGASKGTSSSIKLTMPPGTYSVMCKPSSGAAKSKSAVVKSGQTAFVAFKL